MADQWASPRVLSSLDSPGNFCKVCLADLETTTLQKRTKKLFKSFVLLATKQLRPVRPSITLHSVHLKIDRYVGENRSTEPDDVRVHRAF
jgi:hypothetical protein